jgi:ArsR family transcriptional regulator, arsenate/arsenite/antimonite-responsive transcriptional repressor
MPAPYFDSHQYSYCIEACRSPQISTLVDVRRWDAMTALVACQFDDCQDRGMAKVKVVEIASATSSEPCCPPMMSAPLEPGHAVDMAKMFKALGDPIRLRLLSMIASATDAGETCVCDLTGSFDLSGPTISYHLKILREAGLVESDRRGTWVYYRPVTENFGRLSAVLSIPGVTAALCS